MIRGPVAKLLRTDKSLDEAFQKSAENAPLVG